MSSLYKTWCHCKTTKAKKKTLWHLSEREGGREAIFEELTDRILDHYIAHEEIARLLAELECSQVAELIRTLLPQKRNIKSGELGEILAAEFIEEQLDFKVPVKKLRYKDHRDMPMRGVDVIAVAYDKKNQIKLLKGEAKSARNLTNVTVKKARKALETDYGRPSAHSLIFIARRLIESQDSNMKEMGIDLIKEGTTRTTPNSRLTHLMFTLSGNPATKTIREDLDAADDGRTQHSVNLRIKDHKEFVFTVFEEVSSFGDS